MMYGISDHEGNTGLCVQIMTYKFTSRIKDVEDRFKQILELVRRYNEANGTDPVSDQVKNACIISNTPEPLKTHLQLNVSNSGTFDALRVATEDYLRSRRIFKTTTLKKMARWKLMFYPENGKARANLARARKVARKAKRVTPERVTENRKLTHAI